MFEGVTIQESEFGVANGQRGKIAVLMYVGQENPVTILNDAVSAYVGRAHYFQFVDIQMDNPWIRVVMTKLNDMQQQQFNPLIHSLNGVL